MRLLTLVFLDLFKIGGMNIEHILKESELENHIGLFNFPLESGTVEFKKTIRNWIVSKPVLEKKQADIKSLRDFPELLEINHKKLESLKEEESLILHYKATETSKVAEGQIFFQGDNTKSLNFIPYFIALCVFLKIWIAPAMALLMPLVLAVMPYIIMTQVMNMPIEWEMYTVLMKQMIFGLQNGEPWKLKHYGQAAWTIASVGQGIVQPFITAYHTYNLSNEITKRGHAFIKIHQTISEILDEYKKKCRLFQTFHLPDISNDPLQAAAWIDSEPLGMKYFWKIVGQVVVYTQLARDSSWIPVKWSDNTTKSLLLEPFSDLAIDFKKAVKSSLNLKGHSLLTGPNRGGKSSNLRAILQQVLLGQTTGFTFLAHGSWKPFSTIFTRLKSQDTAGKESLFEMEVRFASQIINTVKKQEKHVLVLIDEIFHSTNPPDAETSAKLFLENLWKHKHAKSIISTHIFSLCEGKHPIQTFCCNAEEQDDGKLKYSYKLTEGGVCKVSSVREVLVESGLMCA
jgi:hypothetical protein